MNRLPPEIISFIAQWVLRIDWIRPGPIIPLTHVCKYWRNSIISAPENWTRISNCRTKLAELSLERAKAAPLEVSITFGFGNRSFDLLLPHAHKVVSLECDGLTAMEELAQALPNFPKSMPKLQSLSLSSHTYNDRGRVIDPFDFSTHTTLRKLSLYDFPLLPSFLGLRALTEFNLLATGRSLHVDTLLRFLEENQSLEHASLNVNFEDASLSRPRRQIPIKSTLQYLLVFCGDEGVAKLLISNIALRKGATLELTHARCGAFERILSGVSTTHLPGLSSPISMEYQLSPRRIQLLGTDGSSFMYASGEGPPLLGVEFPVLRLANMREIRFKCYRSWVPSHLHLSSFPSLEILAVGAHDTGDLFAYDDDSPFDLFTPRGSLSPVLPDPRSSPSLKTLAFLDRAITEDFMAKLTRVALDRRNHTSTSLRRVVIMNSEGRFPSVGSIKRLRKYVSIVELLEGKELPKGLS